jgi:hypothetical protein
VGRGDRVPAAVILRSETAFTLRIARIPAPLALFDVRAEILARRRAVDRVALWQYQKRRRSERPRRVLDPLIAERAQPIIRRGWTAFAEAGIDCSP